MHDRLFPLGRHRQKLKQHHRQPSNHFNVKKRNVRTTPTRPSTSPIPLRELMRMKVIGRKNEAEPSGTITRNVDEWEYKS
nr:hypothetical protein Iba_chr06bCG11370 [Ipomoea batatas]